MAKVRDLRHFYKTVMKKNNGKSDDKVPPFASAIVWKNIGKITLVKKNM